MKAYAYFAFLVLTFPVFVAGLLFTFLLRIPFRMGSTLALVVDDDISGRRWQREQEEAARREYMEALVKGQGVEERK